MCFTWNENSKDHKESKNKFLIIPFNILSINDWHKTIFQYLFSTVIYNTYRKKRYLHNHDQIQNSSKFLLKDKKTKGKHHSSKTQVIYSDLVLDSISQKKKKQPKLYFILYFILISKIWSGYHFFLFKKLYSATKGKPQCFTKNYLSTHYSVVAALLMFLVSEKYRSKVLAQS